eukprot:6378262-Amphidinium_carterae.1
MPVYDPRWAFRPRRTTPGSEQLSSQWEKKRCNILTPIKSLVARGAHDGSLRTCDYEPPG